MELALLLTTALALGALHTFEPDHLAAVSAFAVRKPSARSAMEYGLRWALGHGGIILVAGTLLIAARLTLPESAGVVLERIVGVSLVVLGGWVMATARTLHVHRHAHDDGPTHVHLHAHAHDEGHDHRHAATLIGALHGLAGTAPAVALLPLAGLDSPAVGIGYLVVFGVGTALAMALYAMFAGVVAGKAAARSEQLARHLARFAGLGTILVGVFWLVR